jgi:hypothetical protein
MPAAGHVDLVIEAGPKNYDIARSSRSAFLLRIAAVHLVVGVDGGRPVEGQVAALRPRIGAFHPKHAALDLPKICAGGSDDVQFTIRVPDRVIDIKDFSPGM